MLKILTPVWAGIIGAIALRVNFLRSAAFMKQASNTERGLVEERFKNAIEHLGSDKDPIVLGGIYALHDIAKENESYREPVFNILCGMIRSEGKELSKRCDQMQKKELESLKEQIEDAKKTGTLEQQNILKVRFQQVDDIDYENCYLPSISFLTHTIVTLAFTKKGKKGSIYKIRKRNLSQGNLKAGKLNFFCFNNMELNRTNFTWAELNEAEFIEADLSYVNLISAHLSRAKLYKANLYYADLSRTKLEDTDLSGANLEGSILNETSLNCTNLEGANLNDAILNDSVFYHTKLNKTDFKGSDLTSTKYFDTNDSSLKSVTPNYLKEKGAIFDETTKFLYQEDFGALTISVESSLFAK
ncbi:hypothetical protein FUAX_25220 [Fulvitalea axinellae]|uniref:Pentapeptide repeat-containing protein n=2 Tax=Fulvitalea axinellae TaxID=1182444 RepID=A0AAU9DGE6_9BACT|nr:hypothetical protein FUAX_25220 [Fulvitalea axinellae]